MKYYRVNDGDLRDFFGNFLSDFYKGGEDREKEKDCKIRGAVDLFADDKNFYAELEMPGVNVAEIALNVEDGFLKIKGKRSRFADDKEIKFYQRQIKDGDFERKIKLPSSQIDVENIKANYKNGILEVVIPKQIEVKRKIEVKVVE